MKYSQNIHRVYKYIIAHTNDMVKKRIIKEIVEDSNVRAYLAEGALPNGIVPKIMNNAYEALVEKGDLTLEQFLHNIGRG